MGMIMPQALADFTPVSFFNCIIWHHALLGSEDGPDISHANMVATRALITLW